MPTCVIGGLRIEHSCTKHDLLPVPSLSSHYSISIAYQDVAEFKACHEYLYPVVIDQSTSLCLEQQNVIE